MISKISKKKITLKIVTIPYSKLFILLDSDLYLQLIFCTCFVLDSF